MSGTGSSSSSGSGGNRKIIGFTVKKRIITIPNGATVGPQYCETITEECTPCDGSGTATGSGSATGSSTGTGSGGSNTTCQTGDTFEFGVTYSRPYDTGEEYNFWWQRDVEPGTYSFTVSGMQGGGTMTVYQGDCGSLTNLGDSVFDQCIDVVVGSPQKLRVTLSGVEFGPGTLYITVQIGACP